MYEDRQVGAELQADMQTIVDQLLVFRFFGKGPGKDPGLFILHVFISLSGKVDHLEECFAEPVVFYRI